MPSEFDPWYAPSNLPNGRVHVIVSSRGRQFPAVRALCPRTKKLSWCVIRANAKGIPGVLEWFPWGETKEFWGDFPSAWKPIDPARWTWGSSGEPEPIAAPILFEQNPPLDAVEDSPTVQWWRDPDAISYLPSGAISQDMAEARVMRALALEDQMQLGIKRAVLTRDDAWGMGASEVDWMPPVLAVAQDHDDYGTAMGWLVEVGVSRRDVMVLRGRAMSPPAGWEHLGFRMGKRGPAVRAIYDQLIDRVAKAANRSPRRGPQTLTALRERNRSHRATR